MKRIEDLQVTMLWEMGYPFTILTWSTEKKEHAKVLNIASYSSSWGEVKGIGKGKQLEAVKQALDKIGITRDIEEMAALPWRGVL